MKEYLEGTQRLIDLKPTIALPAHGPPVLENTVALLQQYIAHRKLREDAILQSYNAGNKTLEDLVRTVYKGRMPNIHLYNLISNASHFQLTDTAPQLWCVGRSKTGNSCLRSTNRLLFCRPAAMRNIVLHLQKLQIDGVIDKSIDWPEECRKSMAKGNLKLPLALPPK